MMWWGITFQGLYARVTTAGQTYTAKNVALRRNSVGFAVHPLKRKSCAGEHVCRLQRGTTAWLLQHSSCTQYEDSKG